MSMRVMQVNEVARELGGVGGEGRGRIRKARRDINGWGVYSQANVAALREALIPEAAQAV